MRRVTVELSDNIEAFFHGWAESGNLPSIEKALEDYLIREVGDLCPDANAPDQAAGMSFLGFCKQKPSLR